MGVSYASGLVCFSELRFLHSLTSEKRRPNLLIAADGPWIDEATEQLRTLCAHPFTINRLPGLLDLPHARAGTLVLNDVAALSLEQQIHLFDWMGTHIDVQVVSITERPLFEFVKDGRFLEGLFHRLNTVSLLATPGSLRLAAKLAKT